MGKNVRKIPFNAEPKNYIIYTEMKKVVSYLNEKSLFLNVRVSEQFLDSLTQQHSLNNLSTTGKSFRTEQSLHPKPNHKIHQFHRHFYIFKRRDPSVSCTRRGAEGKKCIETTGNFERTLRAGAHVFSG